jgi:cytochrome c556
LKRDLFPNFYFSKGALTMNYKIANYQIAFLTLCAGLVLGLASCGRQATPVAKPESKAEAPFIPSASIQELMTSTIDTNADDVWSPVATIITKAGIEERAPHTDEEWHAVRRHAVTLAEASNLLMIEGRQVAAPGASTSDVPAELSAPEIQKDIDAHRPEFIAHAKAFHIAVQTAIKAIDAKNTAELVDAGGLIDQACEACHLRFWYPIKRDKTPPLSMTESVSIYNQH